MKCEIYFEFFIVQAKFFSKTATDTIKLKTWKTKTFSFDRKIIINCNNYTLIYVKQ